MEKIDAFFLKKAQKISDWIQDWFGVSNFFLARIFLLFFFVTALMLRIIEFITSKNDSWWVFITLMELLAVTLFYFIIKLAEEKCLSNPTFLNPYQIRLYLLRIMYLIFTIFAIFLLFSPHDLDSKSEDFVLSHMLIDKLALFRELFCLLLLFFASCTPKPPQKSKIKKFIESMSQVLSPKLEHSIT